VHFFASLICTSRSTRVCRKRLTSHITCTRMVLEEALLD
jgi:hypothetical protein